MTSPAEPGQQQPTAMVEAADLCPVCGSAASALCARCGGMPLCTEHSLTDRCPSCESAWRGQLGRIMTPLAAPAVLAPVAAWMLLGPVYVYVSGAVALGLYFGVRWLAAKRMRPRFLAESYSELPRARTSAQDNRE